MGNQISQNNQPINPLSKVIDYIATEYILTQNFKDMKSLTDTKYCDNLVILTTDIIANNLNHEQVKYLSHRIKNGVEKDEIDSYILDGYFKMYGSFPKFTKDYYDPVTQEIFYKKGERLRSNIKLEKYFSSSSL